MAVTRWQDQASTRCCLHSLPQITILPSSISYKRNLKTNLLLYTSSSAHSFITNATLIKDWDITVHHFLSADSQGRSGYGTWDVPDITHWPGYHVPRCAVKTGWGNSDETGTDLNPCKFKTRASLSVCWWGFPNLSTASFQQHVDFVVQWEEHLLDFKFQLCSHHCTDILSSISDAVIRLLWKWGNNIWCNVTSLWWHH